MLEKEIVQNIDDLRLDHGFILSDMSVMMCHAGDESESSDVVMDVQVHDGNFGKELDVVVRNTGSTPTALDAIIISAHISASVDLTEWRLIRGSLTMSFSPVQRIAVPAESPVSLALQSADNYFLVAPTTFTTFESCIRIDENGQLHIRFHGDGRILEAGEVVTCDTLLFTSASDQYAVFETYAERTRAHLGKPLRSVERVRGWASWDAYHEQMTQACIVEEMKWLAEHRHECAVDIIQIDGGWCLDGAWDTCYEAVLPDGMSGFVQQVQAYGFDPGIWLCPFLVKPDAPMFLAHPDWILRKPGLNNEPLTYAGSYVWDGSIPGVCEWIERTFRYLSEDFGIKYFKLDFLTNGLSAVPGRDIRMTSVERYRNFIAAIRRGAGDDAFIVGCNSCVYDAEYFDAARMGPDIQSKWAWDFGIPHSANCISHKFYLSGHLYNGDTDFLIVRHSDDEPDVLSYTATATLNEAKLWADFVTLVSKITMLGDRMHYLPQQRIDVLKRPLNMAIQESIPLDMWQGNETDNPSFYLSRSGDDTYLGIFNWCDEEDVFGISSDEPFSLVGDGIECLEQTSQTVKMPARTSYIVRVQSSLSFAQLRTDLKCTRRVLPARLGSLGENFEPQGQATCIDLSEHLNLSVAYRRTTQQGIFTEKLISWDDLPGTEGMLGVQVSILECRGLHAIGLEEDSLNGIPDHVNGIIVNGQCHSLYFVHTNTFGTQGHCLSYIIHYENDSLEIPIISEDHIGNWEIAYSLPWTEDKSSRLAWIHSGRHHGCYMYEWKNPRPHDLIKSIDIRLMPLPEEKRADCFNRPMVLGITAYAD